MKNITINLLEKETEFGFMPKLVTYILEDTEKRPAVLVCPGGGYAMTSYREAERIAVSYNAAGYHAFVLYYAVSPHKHPLPVLNAAKAIKIIRENAEEWGIEEDKIAVCGFSAGGHLAASISTLWNDSEIFTSDEATNRIHAPNASILAYPVITSGEKAHKGSFVNLIGESSDANEALYNKLSLEKSVTSNNPPTFIWHTYEDQAVPVENSLLLATALRKHDVSMELHIYQKGAHGLSLVSDERIWSVPMFKREYPWLKQSVDWMNSLFGITD